MSWYCDIAPGHPVHGPYHDTEYGFPASDESVLFERLALEIMQAGLSWEIVLKKRPGLFDAFEGFKVDRVARYGETETLRLLSDARIIRNKLKVAAIIENAKRIRGLRKSHGGFSAWIEAHHPLAKEDWVKLFKKTFVFTGGEVVNEFLMSLGYLPGAHRPDCKIAKKIARAKPKPAWMR
ncbi:MAG: DNA-3-methyladenine glycosylase I [Alphaproteobacteria bacterium]|nr:DNA-3-methyladenine glycosylase I [Alphaproteobacteria bacterium]